MTREEALTRYDRIRYNLLNSDDKAAVDVAFEALMEQEKRSKGCEHCLSEVNKSMMLAHGYACCTDCGRRLEEV